MFEGLRKNSQSFMLVILVASLATVFGVSFGPGARGCNSANIRVNHIARVYGATISELDFQSMARIVGLNADARQAPIVRQAIVDGLIERELLAHEAERVGYAIGDDDLNREIRENRRFVSLGMHEVQLLPLVTLQLGIAPPLALASVNYSTGAPLSPSEARPNFSYDDFDNWVRQTYGRTVPDYKRLLAREMLAEFMRNAVISNVHVSEDEVWRDYERQHNLVSLRYVAFSPDFYRDVVNDEDRAGVDAWAQGHTDQINQQYTQRRESFQHVPEQLRMRIMFLHFPEDAQAPSQEATRQRAQALHDRVVAGEDFVRLARLYSQDEHSWRNGGETAWISPDHADLPDDVKTHLHDLTAGHLSDPIASANGVYLVQLLERRQGDVAEADAKREIARELYRVTRGNELAAEAATHAQQLLAMPGATLETVAGTVHGEALTAFYRGDVPGSVTLPGNNTLEPVTHTDIAAPELRETQSFTQTATIPGIDSSAPIVRAAFALTEQAPSPSAPIQVGEARYIIRLRDRQVAARDEFTHDRARLMDQFADAKRREALDSYIARLRADAERRGELHIGNSPLLQQQRTGERQQREEEQG